MPSNLVKLDIGGTIFKTSKSTLCKFDGMLKTMLETNVPIAHDKSNSIFIDRSAKHFDKILNYLRNGEVELPNTKEEVDEIRKEAQYYLLTGLVKLCEAKEVPKAPKKIRYLGSKCEEIAEALANCTKKGVILISYKSDSGFGGASHMATVLRDHGDDYDVYFTPHKPNISSYPDQWQYNLFYAKKPKNGTSTCYCGLLNELSSQIKWLEYCLYKRNEDGTDGDRDPDDDLTS